MTAMHDFDRLVASWLESDGPADVREDLVAESLGTARGIGQRRGVRAWLTGPTPWPALGRRVGLGSMPPALRVAIVIGLLAAATIGVALVGARLLRQTAPAPLVYVRHPGVERQPVDATRCVDCGLTVRRADPRRWRRRGRWEPGGGPGPGHGSFGLDSACGDERRADRCEHAARWASPPHRLDLRRTGVVGPLVGPALRPVDRRRAADRPHGGKSVRVGDGDDGRWPRAHRRRPLEPGDRRGPRQRRDLRSRHQCLQPYGVDDCATDRACTDAAR